MVLPSDKEDKDWLHSLLLDVQLEHFHTRIIDELQVSYKNIGILYTILIKIIQCSL